MRDPLNGFRIIVVIGLKYELTWHVLHEIYKDVLIKNAGYLVLFFGIPPKDVGLISSKAALKSCLDSAFVSEEKVCHSYCDRGVRPVLGLSCVIE